MSPAERLAEIEKRRAARKAEADAAELEQEITDLEAIDALEAQHGYNSVSVLRVPFLAEGLPVRVAVRTPLPVEIKRFRDTLKPRKDRRGNDVQGDNVLANEQLGAACLIYPAPDVLAKLCEKRPALLSQLGQVATVLSVASEEESGKG